MKINDLSYNATGARYGYNSQEQSTELNLDGNHTTAEFWEYDARSARRWNLDPVDQISKSNYATFANNPITYNDLNGDRWGVTLFFGETEAGGGIGLSSDYVKQHGTAYDEIGTTLFTASKFNVFNKDTDIHDSWDWSLGISASQSAAFAHSWNAELFSDIFESYSISKGFNIEGEYGIGGGLGVSMDMFSLQVGIGWGGESIIN